MKSQQSNAGLIRQRLDEIEQQMVFGKSHTAIVDEFRAQGFEMTVASFRTELYRARKWRAENGIKSVRQQPANRLPEPRRSAGIAKPETAAINGRIRNPGNIDESELY